MAGLDELWIIGDAHGKLEDYQRLTNQYPRTLQLGDFGFKKQYDWHFANIDCINHQVLGGNHDYWSHYYQYPFTIGSTYLDPEGNKHLGRFGEIQPTVFAVGGAYSIDAYHRIEGRSWFRNEQMSWKEANACIELYTQLKPEFVISHDCPQFFAEKHFDCRDRSVTRSVLNELYDIHQPTEWVFGHWHRSLVQEHGPTTFRCLAELETYQLL